MLSLHNVKIYIQKFGSILGIFLVSKSKTAIEERYYSFYNHMATGGDLEWWSDNCALFWIYSGREGTAEDKLYWALVDGVLAELLNKGHTKGIDPYPRACEIAEERLQSMDHVTWFQPEAVWDMFDMGDSVTAEKGTGNFDDDVLGSAVTRKGKSTLDSVKMKNIDADEDTEHETEETESVGQNV